MNHGDIIVVRVGGKSYETVVDDKGVQRFRKNPNHPLLLTCPKKFDAALGAETYDLNEMSRRFALGRFKSRDYAEMHMALGYSVSGFCELPAFMRWRVDNPGWPKVS